MAFSVTTLLPSAPWETKGSCDTATWQCLQLVLAAVPARVAVARREVVTHLAWWGLGGLQGDAALITSELATNAVRHGAGTSMTVWLARLDEHVLIAVADHSPAASVPAGADRAGADQESGRGLAIVRGLASQWGIQAQPDGGKLVWATLPISG